MSFVCLAMETNAPSPTPDDRYERFVMLLARHEPAIHSYVVSLVGHWDDAADVMQQTSLVLWKKFDAFDPATSFPAWACAIARYEALNFRKKQRRDRHVFSNELLDTLADESLDELDEREAERRALAACLDKLTPDDRDLIEQVYAGETTIRLVAERLGRTANSIYKRLDRIRVGLLRCIERALADGGER